MLRDNELVADGRVSRIAPGPQSKLNDAQMAELRALVIAGPDAAIHAAVRWRRVDLRDVVARRYGGTVMVRTATVLLLPSCHHHPGRRFFISRSAPSSAAVTHLGKDNFVTGYAKNAATKMGALGGPAIRRQLARHTKVLERRLRDTPSG